MAFDQLQQLVTEANVEQEELNAALVVLDAAKAELVQVQETLAQKQGAVDQAREAAGVEKADVIAKIQAILVRCNEILSELQA